MGLDCVLVVHPPFRPLPGPTHFLCLAKESQQRKARPPSGRTRRVRDSEFGDGPRAGFCLMGACQDCWVWTPAGERLRACSTPAEAGMDVLTRPPTHYWPVTPDLRDTLARHAPETAE